MIHAMSHMDEALAALQKYFGFEEFREGQTEVISAVLEGHDTVVVMPTGGGKSLCFQLPALMKEGVTVVVSPLIALMKDQVDALQARGRAACEWAGGKGLPWLLLVTHEAKLATRHAGRVVTLVDGRIHDDTRLEAAGREPETLVKIRIQEESR